MGKLGGIFDGTTAGRYCTDMSTPNVKRKRMTAEDRRRQVLDVAAEVFSKKGYRVAAVTDIVEGAGIGRGTFYLYFDSKKDVFLELVERYFSEFEELLKENHKRLKSAIKEGGDVIPVWQENMMRVVRYHRENPHLTSLVYRDALGRDEDFSDRVEELSRVARKHLVEQFGTLRKHGLIRPCDLEVVASVVMGASVYVIKEHVVEESKRDPEELVDELIMFNVRALMPNDRRVAKGPKAKAPKRIIHRPHGET